MTMRISHTSFDSHDAYAQSAWWGAALGMRGDPQDPNNPGDEECMIFSPDGRTRLLFIEVPDEKVVKNRIHLDLRPETTREDEVVRLLSLGATQLADRRRPDESGWGHPGRPGGKRVLRAPW